MEASNVFPHYGLAHSGLNLIGKTQAAHNLCEVLRNIKSKTRTTKCSLYNKATLQAMHNNNKKRTQKCHDY